MTIGLFFDHLWGIGNVPLLWCISSVLALLSSEFYVSSMVGLFSML